MVCIIPFPLKTQVMLYKWRLELNNACRQTVSVYRRENMHLIYLSRKFLVGESHSSEKPPKKEFEESLKLSQASKVIMC
jgi:hypothetical protein